MAIIDFSTGFASGLPQRLLGVGVSENSNMNPANARLLVIGGAADPNMVGGNLYLMKGLVPTSFSELPNRAARLSDVLCTFSAGDGDNVFVNTTTGNPSVIQTTFKTATASGACTWFWLASHTFVRPGESHQPFIDVGNTVYQQCYGTVGLPGSGSDLEMGDVNIVSGQQYQVTNLRLQFPTSFSY
jgi:hypothetical protein